jgi:hypothetical protein
VIGEATQKLLLSWAIKAGREQGFTLANSLKANAVAVLWNPGASLRDGKIWLKNALQQALQKSPLSQEVSDTAARELRTEAASLDGGGYSTSRLDAASGRVDQENLRNLLTEIADILSPSTKDEAVRSRF